MKLKIVFLSIFLTITFSFGQEDEKEILNSFFETFEKNPEEALDYIYNTNKWIDANGDSVKQLKGQLSQLITLVGAYYGEEFIYKSKIGESFSTYIYLAKYDRQPIRFTFEFYKPKDDWILYSFKYDDSFDDDLQEIMKYEYLKKF